MLGSGVKKATTKDQDPELRTTPLFVELTHLSPWLGSHNISRATKETSAQRDKNDCPSELT